MNAHHSLHRSAAVKAIPKFPPFQLQTYICEAHSPCAANFSDSDLKNLCRVDLNISKKLDLQILSQGLASGKLSHNYMENHHFSWVNQLFLWQISIAMFDITRPGSSYSSWETHPPAWSFQPAMQNHKEPPQYANIA